MMTAKKKNKGQKGKKSLSTLNKLKRNMMANWHGMNIIWIMAAAISITLLFSVSLTRGQGGWSDGKASPALNLAAVRNNSKSILSLSKQEKFRPTVRMRLKKVIESGTGKRFAQEVSPQLIIIVKIIYLILLLWLTPRRALLDDFTQTL